MRLSIVTTLSESGRTSFAPEELAGCTAGFLLTYPKPATFFEANVRRSQENSRLHLPHGCCLGNLDRTFRGGSSQPPVCSGARRGMPGMPGLYTRSTHSKKYTMSHSTWRRSRRRVSHKRSSIVSDMMRRTLVSGVMMQMTPQTTQKGWSYRRATPLALKCLWSGRWRQVKLHPGE